MEHFLLVLVHKSVRFMLFFWMLLISIAVEDKNNFIFPSADIPMVRSKKLLVRNITIQQVTCLTECFSFLVFRNSNQCAKTNPYYLLLNEAESKSDDWSFPSRLCKLNLLKARQIKILHFITISLTYFSN